MTDTVPFFVADRPMSLRLLKGLPLQDYPGARIGIMAHANTTLNFQKAFADYPCEDTSFCDAIGGPCKYTNNIEQCPLRKYILSHTIKMCDSGIFTREGAKLSYEELFKAYERMGVEYGIMIDVYQDASGTLQSAKEALRVYKPYKNKFRLIAVAQGNTEEEYFECYRSLKKLGFSHIALGGLIRRIDNSVRYTKVGDEAFMYRVLDKFREGYPEDWLFALGALHPKRIEEFRSRNVWGDYKGWILKYEKKNATLDKAFSTLTAKHLKHLKILSPDHLVKSLQANISKRQNLIQKQTKLTKRLHQGKRSLRISLHSLYKDLLIKAPQSASKIKGIINYGLLSKSATNKVEGCLKLLRRVRNRADREILANIESNHKTKAELILLERKTNRVNHKLATIIADLLEGSNSLPLGTRRFCKTILNLISKSERSHRFEQVRKRIGRTILAAMR